MSCGGFGSVAAGHVTTPHRIISATRITPRSMPCSGWTAGFARLDAFVAAYDAARARVAALRDPSATVELATVHASKGREWETVVLIGFEADRIPNRRSLIDADDARPRARGGASPRLRRRHPRDSAAHPGLRSVAPIPFLAEMGYGHTRRPERLRRPAGDGLRACGGDGTDCVRRIAIVAHAERVPEILAGRSTSAPSRHCSGVPAAMR